MHNAISKDLIPHNTHYYYTYYCYYYNYYCYHYKTRYLKNCEATLNAQYADNHDVRVHGPKQQN